MPVAKQLLMVRADWDTATQYGSYWLGQAKSMLLDLGMLVTDLAGILDDKTDVVNAINEVDPSVFWGMGHGLETQFAGQDNYLLLEKGVDESLMVGRVVHLTSCLTGAEGGLLQSFAKAGAITCFGYNVELILGVETNNFPDSPDNDATKSLMKPDTDFEIALAKGMTAKEAYDDSNNVADAEMEYWRTSGHPDADLLIYCHIHNKSGKILYGEGGTITGAEAPPVSNIAVASLLASAFGLSLAVVQILGGK
jgi:hypothetical protein